MREIKYSEIIENQPTINIGSIGHVSHGKSTLIKSITGVKTQRHTKEQERNITINLGYANAKIFRCPNTGYIKAVSSSVKELYHPETKDKMELIKHISFVDCPGHESFMATMISGSSIMNAAFLLIAANDTIIPQQQTYEHLATISKTNIDNVLVLQNKLDLIDEESCFQNKEKIDKFLEGSIAERSTVLPISAQLSYNIDYVLKYITDNIVEPEKIYDLPAEMTIVRSFDINKPGTYMKDVKGGVIGGSIKQGILEIGDYIELRPGIISRDSEGLFICQPIISKVLSLNSDKNVLEYAIPGGLIAIGTTIDPIFTRSNGLVGQTAGLIGTLAPIYTNLTVKYSRFKRMDCKKKSFKMDEKLIITINSMVVSGDIYEINKTNKEVSIKLSKPVSAKIGDNVSLLRMFDHKYKLDCYGSIVGGEKITNIKLHPKYLDLVEQMKKKKKIKIIQDVEPLSFISSFDYQELLSNIKFRSNSKMKINIVQPNVVKMNRKSVFTNFYNCCEKINFYKEGETELPSDAKYIEIHSLFKKYLENELSVTTSINDQNQLLINGAYRSNQIQSILYKYIKKYIICPNCKQPQTIIYKKSKLTFQYCISCFSSNSISI